MSKSLLSNEKVCFRCGTTIGLEKHHIYSNCFRKKSEHYGCWIYLCHLHHTGNEGVHTHAGTQYWNYLKKVCQREFEAKYGRELFLKEFKRDYL